MDIKGDNPAGRLYNILNNLIGIGENPSFCDALLIGLGLDRSARKDFFYYFYDLQNLFIETRETIIQIKELNHDLYLTNFPKMEHIFEIENIIKPWNQVKESFLDTASLQSLAFCSDELSRYSPEKIIEEKELSKIQNEVDDLSNYVMQSNIDDKLKKIIWQQLEIIRRSIVEYKINGANALEKALRLNIGTLYLYKGSFPKIKNDKGFQRFVKIVAKLMHLVVLAKEAYFLFAPHEKEIEEFIESIPE